MCVSYRPLNKVTTLYAYPIPIFNMAITIFQIGLAKLWVVNVDAKQGYYQVVLRDRDVDKLDFFAPNYKKYCFKVMPFRLVNAPTFYTCIMGIFKKE